MPWSYANIDWNGTGAMVQAIGSVAAIAAAVWIDRGARRRVHEERRLGKAAAADNRIFSLMACVVSLRRAAAKIKEMDVTAVTYIPEGILTDLRAGRTALTYLLAHPADIDGGALRALSTAAEAYHLLFDRMMSDYLPIHHNEGRDRLVLLLERGEEEILHIMELYRSALVKDQLPDRERE